MANAGGDGGRLFLELAQRVTDAGDTASGAGADPGMELAFSVILRRVLEVSFCWALGLTGFSIVGFAAVSLYLGLSSAMILSSITMEKGLLGPFIYLAAMLPQAFIYIPVFLVLAFWALSRENGRTGRLRAPSGGCGRGRIPGNIRKSVASGDISLKNTILRQLYVVRVCGRCFNILYMLCKSVKNG